MSQIARQFIVIHTENHKIFGCCPPDGAELPQDADAELIVGSQDGSPWRKPPKPLDQCSPRQRSIWFMGRHVHFQQVGGCRFPQPLEAQIGKRPCGLS